MERRANPPLAPGGSARAAERTLDILLAFLREGRALGISELARAVRLPKATVHRLVTVLVSRGFLERNAANAHYRIGLTLFRLGNIFLAQTQVRQVAPPVLHELARMTGETVNLNVVMDRRRVCIEKAESTHDIRHAVELGRPLPLYAGASGKVLLAYLPEEDVRQVLAEGLRRLTPRTVVSAHRLKRDLAEIRRQGFAVSRDERVEGASSVSAPVKDGSGQVVAGLTISGPTYRLTPEHLREYEGLVLEGARRISAALGYSETAPRRERTAAHRERTAGAR